MLTLYSAPAWAQVTINPGDILVVDPNASTMGNGAVIRITTSGTQTIVSSGQNFIEPVAIAIEADGKIVVTDRNVAAVIRVDPAKASNANQTIVHAGGPFIDPFGIALEANGNILVSDTGCAGHNCTTGHNISGGGAATVYRVDPVSGTTTAVSPIMNSGTNFLDRPYGIDVEADGKIVVTDATSNVGSMTGQGGIIRINPANGVQSVVSVGMPPPMTNPPDVFGCPFGIVVDPILGSILTSVFKTSTGYGCQPGAIFRADKLSGTQSNVSPHEPWHWAIPFGMAVDVDGSIVVADEGFAQIFRVNPATGVPTSVSQGINLVNPTDVAIAGANTPPPLNGADL